MGVEAKFEGEVREGFYDFDPDLSALEGVETLGFYTRDGSPLGFVAYTIDSDRGILRLELAKSFSEGRGVFRGLFFSLKDLAKDLECKRIVLSVGETNNRAIDIYEHYGFRETGRSYVGTNSINFLEMVLRVI